MNEPRSGGAVPAQASRRRVVRAMALAFLALVGVIVGVTIAGGYDPWSSFEKKTLNPGFRSAATPADLGLKFERVAIPSGPRVLDGFLVRADASCADTAAVLIFHGRNETVADWINVQQRLHQSCISSLVFDYSGHGRSTPPGTIDNLDADAVAADQFFLNAFPATERRCLLSHSMGGGPMLYAATRPDAAPDCVVIANPFASLRAMAVLGGLPKAVSLVMPDRWDNVQMAARLHAPMLWIHSKSDTTIPIAQGQKVYDAAAGPKSAIVLTGFGHNAIQDQMPSAIWSPITSFILHGLPRATQSGS
ncbi:MAG: alpha/beta fold hydrolase [Candidatus Binataceae bacterium]